MNILVTAAGSPGFLSVRSALKSTRGLKSEFELHACDMSTHSMGMQTVNNSFTVPPGGSKNYIPTLLKYCRENSIELVIPCADGELLPLARAKTEFKNIGCQVLVSSPDSIATCLDKGELFKFCLSNSLEKYIVAHEICSSVRQLRQYYDELSTLGHQVCIKPTAAHGSRGFRVLEGLPTREEFFSQKAKPHNMTIENLLEVLSHEDKSTFPGLLVMEYLPGREYSVDCFMRRGDFICIPRTREIIKDGICVSGQVQKNEELIEAAQLVYKKLGLRYNANIQFRYDKEGKPKLLEVNPRFAGTMEHCRGAGINLVEVAVHDILGLTPYQYDIKWGTKMNRVWSEIFERNGEYFTLAENQ